MGAFPLAERLSPAASCFFALCLEGVGTALAGLFMYPRRPSTQLHEDICPKP